MAKHEDLEERFWSKVAVTNVRGCWLWLASRRSGGYGQFALDGRRRIRASRFAWELTYGAIESNLFVLHECDNPPCCNPTHLFLGTHGDNMADMVAKGRTKSGNRRVNSAEDIAIFVENVRRLSDNQIDFCRRRHQEGASLRQIAREVGVTHTTVMRLVNNVSWKNN